MNSEIPLTDVWGKKEDLHPDLQEYYEEGGMFPMVRHPLCYSVPHMPEMNAFVNARYKLAKERAENALGRCNYLGYLWCHERPYRLSAFMRIQKHLSPQIRWQTLAEIWTDSENIYQNQHLWREALFEYDMAGSEFFMNEEERRFLSRKSQFITIYRGVNCFEGHEGFSWTTDRLVALRFAERFRLPEQQAYIFQGEVNKALVLGYKNDRNEAEIVVDYLDVKITDEEEIA